MNDTQWVFEMETIRQEESKRYEDIRMMADIVRDQMVRMLGLNLCPVEDPETGLLRMPEGHEMMPLAVMTGRDDVLQIIRERHEELMTQEDVRAQLGPGAPEDAGGIVELTPEELQSFMDDSGDVEFDSTPEELQKAMGWGDAFSQQYLESTVLNKDDIEEGTLDAAARTIGQARADIRREAAKNRESEVAPVETILVEIMSDRAAEQTVPEEGRPVVVVDTD